MGDVVNITLAALTFPRHFFLTPNLDWVNLEANVKLDP